MTPPTSDGAPFHVRAADVRVGDILMPANALVLSIHPTTNPDMPGAIDFLTLTTITAKVTYYGDQIVGIA